MITVEVSPDSLLGLGAVSLTHSGAGAPLAIRVVDSPVARIVGRLATRATTRAARRGHSPRIDLDELVARAEVIAACGFEV